MDGDGDDRSSRPRLPRWLTPAVALLAALVVFGTWAIASPPGSSPDDIYHSVSIWCAGGEQPGVCEVQDSGVALVPAQVTFGICHAHDPTKSAQCYAEAPDVMSPQELGRYQLPGWGKFYPPIYYRVMHTLVTSDTGASLLAMRLVNAAIAIGFGALALGLAMRGRRGGAAVSWLVSLMPMGLFLIASLNPHSWGVTGTASAWLLALSWREQPSRGRRVLTAVACLAAIGIAFAGRFDAGLYAAIGAACGLALSPALVRWAKERARALQVTALAAVIAVGLLATVSGQGNFLTIATRGPEGISLDQLFRNVGDIPQLWFGNFGSFGGYWGLGQFDTVVPAAAGVLGVVAFGAAILLGLGHTWFTKAVAVAFLAGLLVFIPAYMFQLGLVDGAQDVGNGIQPRYLLPLLIVLAGIALVSRTANGGLWASSAQRWMLWICVTVAHAFALHALLRRYITGQELRTLNLDVGIEWWWHDAPSPMAVWLIGSVAFAVLAYLALSLLREPEQDVPMRPSLGARGG